MRLCDCLAAKIPKISGVNFCEGEYCALPVDVVSLLENKQARLKMKIKIEKNSIGVKLIADHARKDRGNG